MYGFPAEVLMVHSLLDFNCKVNCKEVKTLTPALVHDMSVWQGLRG
jgi:hypothetical protein